MEPFELTILVLPGSSLMTVAAVLDPWRALNRVAGRVCARWALVSAEGAAVPLTCGLRLPVEGRLRPEARGDLLAVVAGFDAPEHALPALAALRRAAPRFGLLAGIESGAWVLGALGALDGRRATAHWEDLEDFAQALPRAEVVADRWTADGRVLTAGGASPALDLMLHLIRSRWGEAAALGAASVFVHDARPGDEAQPMVSLGALSAREPRVAAAVRAMAGSLDRPLSTAAIARRAGLSPRRLESLFRATLGTTPGRYYAGLRMAAARRLVTDTALPLAEVALRTGFGSLPAFSRAFRRETGSTARAARAGARAGRGLTVGSRPVD